MPSYSSTAVGIVAIGCSTLSTTSEQRQQQQPALAAASYQQLVEDNTFHRQQRQQAKNTEEIILSSDSSSDECESDEVSSEQDSCSESTHVKVLVSQRSVQLIQGRLKRNHLLNEFLCSS